MPEDIKKQDLIDVGETEGAEINLDDKGEAVKQEEVKEEIEVEQVKEPTKEVDKSFENERETKLAKPEEKDELKEYSEGVQKRIAKLTRKMREAERQREEAVNYAQSIKQQKDQAETRLSKLDKSYVSEFESRVTTSMAAAKLALKNAIESQDVEAQIAAQEQLANLTVESARVNALKAREVSTPKEKEVNVTPQQQPIQQSDPKAEEWATKNPWFGNDTAMTYTAFDLHKKLVDEQGYDPKTDEYYAAIDKQMRLDFPHKFAKTVSQESTKPTQTVASATRSVKPGRNTVRLTSSQVAIAKKLNVPLEEYAKQLKITKEA